MLMARRFVTLAIATSTCLFGSACASGQSVVASDETQRLVETTHARYAGLTEGENADYIPALAEVPSELFGISIVSVDGTVYDVGDTDVPFSIQSISKAFVLALVMEELGADAIREKIGVDATGRQNVPLLGRGEEIGEGNGHTTRTQQRQIQGYPIETVGQPTSHPRSAEILQAPHPALDGTVQLTVGPCLHAIVQRRAIAARAECVHELQQIRHVRSLPPAPAADLAFGSLVPQPARPSAASRRPLPDPRR